MMNTDSFSIDRQIFYIGDPEISSTHEVKTHSKGSTYLLTRLFGANQQSIYHTLKYGNTVSALSRNGFYEKYEIKLQGSVKDDLAEKICKLLKEKHLIYVFMRSINDNRPRETWEYQVTFKQLKDWFNIPEDEMAYGEFAIHALSLTKQDLNILDTCFLTVSKLF